MNLLLDHIFKVSARRYPDAYEESLIRSHYQGMPERLSVLEQLERRESDILNQALSGLANAAQLQAPLALFLRHAALAWVDQDAEALKEIAVYWLAPRLEPLGLNPADQHRLAQQMAAATQSLGALSQWLQALEPRRTQAVRELDRAAAELTPGLVAETYQRFPAMLEMSQGSYESGYRDMEYILSSCAAAVLLQDESYLRVRLGWIQHIFAPLNFDPRLLPETYTQAAQRLRTLMSAASYDVAAPYIEKIAPLLVAKEAV